MSARFLVGIACNGCGFEFPHTRTVEHPSRYFPELVEVRVAAAERGWRSSTHSRAHRDLCPRCVAAQEAGR